MEVISLNGKQLNLYY